MCLKLFYCPLETPKSVLFAALCLLLFSCVASDEIFSKFARVLSICNAFSLAEVQ